MSSEKDNREFVTALARGLDVIKVFTQERPELTLSEVASFSGLTPATARRFLHPAEPGLCHCEWTSFPADRAGTGFERAVSGVDESAGGRTGPPPGRCRRDRRQFVSDDPRRY